MPSIMPTAQDCFRLLFKLNGLVDFSWLCLKKHGVARSWNCECTCMKVNLHNMKMADNLNVMIFTLYLSQISQCWTALSQGKEIKWVWLSTFLFTWSGKKSKHWRHKHWKVNIACTEFIFHSLKWGGASISYQVIRQVSHPHCHCHKEDHNYTGWLHLTLQVVYHVIRQVSLSQGALLQIMYNALTWPQDDWWDTLGVSRNQDSLREAATDHSHNCIHVSLLCRALSLCLK